MKYIIFIPLITLFIWLSFSALSEYNRYCAAVVEYKDVDSRLVNLDGECKQIRQRINALKNNPKAVERVAREKFGWCREGEEIYSFASPSQWQ